MMRQMLGTALIALVLAACAGTQGMGGASADGAQPLAGTSWVLEELNGAAPAAGVTTPTLLFGTDARVNGNAGCNLFNGPYTQGGATLDMGPLVSTRRACADPAGNAQETAYLRTLDEVARAAVVDGRLELSTSAGVVARFRRAT